MLGMTIPDHCCDTTALTSFQKKIIDNQMKLTADLKKKTAPCDDYGLLKDPLFINLIEQMLNMDPAKRPSPETILNH